MPTKRGNTSMKGGNPPDPPAPIPSYSPIFPVVTVVSMLSGAIMAVRCNYGYPVQRAEAKGCKCVYPVHVWLFGATERDSSSQEGLIIPQQGKGGGSSLHRHGNVGGGGNMPRLCLAPVSFAAFNGMFGGECR